MSKPQSIDDSNFEQMVLKSDKPALLDFWAVWCRPCAMIAPILDELANEYEGKVNFFKLDVDHNPKTATRYGIMSIPTVLIFKGGQPMSQLVGLKSKAELKKSLNAVIG